MTLKSYLDNNAAAYGLKLYKLTYQNTHVYKVEFVKAGIKKPEFKLYIEFNKKNEIDTKVSITNTDETKILPIEIKYAKFAALITDAIINNDNLWYSPEYYYKLISKKKEVNKFYHAKRI